jgi:hypothetical protein
MSGAKAALVSVNFETEDVKVAIYDEEIGHGDPVQACWNFWDSIKHGWPGYVPDVIMNDECAKIERKKKLAMIGINDDD